MVTRIRAMRVMRMVPLAGVLTLCGCAALPPGFGRVAGDLSQLTGAQVGDPASETFFMPNEVRLADGLAENEAVALALANNPEFKAQLAELGITAAEVLRAQLLPNPSLAAVLGSSWEATLIFPFDILWRRGARIDAAAAVHASRVQQTMQAGLDLVLNVRLAHVNAVLAERQFELAEAAVGGAGRVSGIATARLEAGDASGLEVVATTAAAAAAIQDAGQARIQRESARLALRRLCRLDASTWNGMVSPSATGLPAVGDSNALVRLAQENRADVRSAALELEAAGAAIGLARAEAFSFGAGAKASDGNDGTSVVPALSVSLPLFNRGQAEVNAARSRLQVATQRYRARLDQAELEVRDAAFRVEQAAIAVRAWRDETVPALGDTVARAERAFGAGDIPYLAVLDVQRRLLDARRTEAAAVADLQRASVSLAHHTGGMSGVMDEGATR